MGERHVRSGAQPGQTSGRVDRAPLRAALLVAAEPRRTRLPDGSAGRISDDPDLHHRAWYRERRRIVSERRLRLEPVYELWASGTGPDLHGGRNPRTLRVAHPFDLRLRARRP